jgi:hypothetical protein
VHVRNQINSQADEGKALTTDNLLPIRPEDTSRFLSQEISRNYMDIVAEKKEGE